MNFLPIVPYDYRLCCHVQTLESHLRLHERLQLELKNRKATPQELGRLLFFFIKKKVGKSHLLLGKF
jgi:hypothetical protein